MNIITVLQWGVILLWGFWLTVYWNLGRDVVEDVQAATSPRDAAAIRTITAATALLLLSGAGIALGVAQPFMWAFDVRVAVVGAALTVLGMVGTFYFRGYLGRYWTAEIALQDDHRVIDSGPYAVVRHPIYTAAITMYAGTALLFASYVSLAAFVVVAAAYVIKTAEEDAYLQAALPGYAAYAAKVRQRLLPGVW